jgi:prophage regulatory protein
MTTSHTPHGDLVILRRRAVSLKTGLPDTSLYELVASGQFPKPITLSKRRVGWLLHEIEDWLRERIRATREQGQRAQPIRRHRRVRDQ